MKSFKIGDRVLLNKRLELPNIEIETTKVLVIESIDQNIATLRYGKKPNQTFKITIDGFKLITLEQISKLNPSTAYVVGNFNVGEKGILNHVLGSITFIVTDIHFSTSIYEDFFNIKIIGNENNEKYLVSGRDMINNAKKIDKEKIKKPEIEKSEVKKQNYQTVTNQDLKNLITSILGKDNEMIVELPTHKEFTDQLSNFCKQIQKEKKSKQSIETKSSVKPIKSIGTLHEKPTMNEVKQEFEKELIKINEKIEKHSKSSKIKIDGIDIELLESGEIKVPPITRKNLSDISDVLNKLDTILNFKGEK